MRHVIDADYLQEYLFPASMEEWVGPRHPARFIREFVDALNLESLDITWALGEGGRPAFSGGLLLKVWLYGYFKGIRSTRKLEEACRDNVGFIWLCGAHCADHNTLSGFFRANKKGIRALFRKSVQVAMQAELVGFVLHAVDGTKLQAEVANRTGWHQDKLNKLLKRLDERILELEQEIERNNAGCESSDELPKALAQRQALRKRIQEALTQLDEVGQKHLHPADEDARVVKCQDRNRNTFGYNAQAVADEKEGVVVACETVQDANDTQQLNAMIGRAEHETGRTAEQTVADTGYATGSEFAQAEEQEREVLVNLPKRMRPNPDSPFHASNFTYDPEGNVCICPQGGILSYRHTRKHNTKGYELRLYRCTVADCPHRAQCTKDKKGRSIELNQYYEAVARQRDKQQDPAAQQALAKRCHIIEPVFAFIKQNLGFRRFTVSGLDNVQAQWALLCTAHNLHKLFKRWENRELTLPAARRADFTGPRREPSATLMAHPVSPRAPDHFWTPGEGRGFKKVFALAKKKALCHTRKLGLAF
jgi:transposase